MAYVLLINEDNTISTTKRERIMQRSKLVDTLWFLVNPIYQKHDMSDSTVLLEYVLPCSKKYGTKILRLADEGYEEYLKYLLPEGDDMDTDLTSEAGKVELQLTFAYTDLDSDGNGIQRVRKTSTTTINVVPIAAWSDLIPDSALSVLDQRIIKTDAQIKALNDYAEALSDSKADNIEYDEYENALQLTAAGNKIGDKVVLKDCVDEDGVPVVDFGSGIENPDEPVVPDDESDVVEF